MKKFGVIIANVIMFFIIYMCINISNCYGFYVDRYNNSAARPSDKDGSLYYSILSQNNSKIALYKLTSNDSNIKNNMAIYSMKNGLSFRIRQGANYTQHFKNMNEMYNYIGDHSINNKTKAIEWILNNIALTKEDMEWALDKAGISYREMLSAVSRDDLFEIMGAVQQAAIWYYTNDEPSKRPGNEANFYVSRINSSFGQSLEGDFNYGMFNFSTLTNKRPVTTYYKYLIDEASRYMESTDNIYTNEDTVTTNDNSVMQQYNNYYIAGPYTIGKDFLNNENLRVEVKNKGREISAKILNADKSIIDNENLGEALKNNDGKAFYVAVPKSAVNSNTTLEINVRCELLKTHYDLYTATKNIKADPIVTISRTKQTLSKLFTPRINLSNVYDLSLRQFITKVSNVDVEPKREPQITKEDLQKLKASTPQLDGKTTTVVKTSNKKPVEVKVNDIIRYTIRVYNEGELPARAKFITEFLPPELEFVQDSRINKKYGWIKDNTAENRYHTNYLSNTTIKPFDKDRLYLDYQDVEIECRIKATKEKVGVHIKNVAEITGITDEAGRNVNDIDSTPYNIFTFMKNAGEYENNGYAETGRGYEDDDDYESVVIEGNYFDLALRQFIISIEDKNGNQKLTDKREPVVDVSKLKAGKQTTAIYKHQKKPVSVESGDIVTFNIRIYNEGQLDGYADEIICHLPKELEFVQDIEDKNHVNASNGWIIDNMDKTFRTLKTNKLARPNYNGQLSGDKDNLIKKFDTNGNQLYYKDVFLKCKVSKVAKPQTEITNIVEISKSSNDLGLADRDNKASVILPENDEAYQRYIGNKENKFDLGDTNYFYKGQEDDDDFEKMVLERFDLALRQYITAINKEEIKNREPMVDVSNFAKTINNKEVTTFDYKHTKEPAQVCQTDVIKFNIRVYNEGSQAGYVRQIKDTIPEGLEFIPEDSTNLKYKWRMFDKNNSPTVNPKEARYVITEYLSKENGEQNKLEAYLGGNFSYKDVEIVLKVVDVKTKDRILENRAEIIAQTDLDGKNINDIDSNQNRWIDGEDDQDSEKLYVKFFDLELKQCTISTILIEEGIQRELATGHKPEDAIEPILKLELNNKNVDNTVVKFKYKIKVSNKGQIGGYCQEISNYIPTGLSFNKADNPKWKEVDGKLITEELKDKKLEPESFATVDLILTWKNDSNFAGIMTNIAEISKDYNDKDTADINSIPNNKKEKENDIDTAPVSIHILTSKVIAYIILGTVAVIIIVIGIYIIKKYVLEQDIQTNLDFNNKKQKKRKNQLTNPNRIKQNTRNVKDINVKNNNVKTNNIKKESFKDKIKNKILGFKDGKITVKSSKKVKKTNKKLNKKDNKKLGKNTNKNKKK